MPLLKFKGTQKAVPEIKGYDKVWADEFIGPSGSPPNTDNWDNIIQYPNYNREVQAYTASVENLYLSGDGELYIVPKRLAYPRRDGATWESGRLECWHSWTCAPREKMLIQAEIKLGDNKNQLGIWPAFWTLGQKIREGVSWPFCGECDIMETVNSSGINHGVVHFSFDPFVDKDSKGHDAGNAYPQKFSRTVPCKEGRYHTYALRIDRTPNSWQEEKLTWYIDGRKYFQLTGSDVGAEAQWSVLAHNAYFPLLNVAVGGDFPNGAHNPSQVITPTLDTQDGVGSGMKVRYVAVYKSTK